jgi:hypothetical protein
MLVILKTATHLAYNGPAIKVVFGAEGTAAVGSIYRIDFQAF